MTVNLTGPTAIHDPLVSVIMNGYNCEKYLKQAIDSVFSQTYQNWEIIFWDNASTDATQSIATSYEPKLRYFRSETNTTLGSARNSALEQARGEFIAFLDTDDYWLSEKLSLQVSVLQSMRNVGVLYTNYYVLDQETGRMRKGLKKKQPSGNVFGSFLRHYPVNLQTVMLRKSAMASLDHLFDSRLSLCEEFDLFMRIAYNSEIHFSNITTSVYRIHVGMSSIKYMQRYPLEAEICLNKLLTIDSRINISYESEIKIFEKKIAFWKARGFMYNHSAYAARNCLMPHIFSDARFLFLFACTYSRPIWNWLLKYT